MANTEVEMSDTRKPRIIARVPTVSPWPKHAIGKQYPSSKITPSAMVKGAVRVLGIGKPTAPDHTWICDTDLVWPVYEVNGKTLEPHEGKLPFACRHQIVAGD
jgi:hypothetical protein